MGKISKVTLSRKAKPEDNLRHKFKPKCRGTRLSPSHPTNRTATMTKRSFDFHLMSKVVCLKHARHVAPSFICSAPTSIRLRSSYRHDGPRWSPDLKAQHSGTEWPSLLASVMNCVPEMRSCPFCTDTTRRHGSIARLPRSENTNDM